MKKSLVLSGIAIASLVVCLVVKVPASFVWQKLKAEELVPASIELEGIRGTVWSGSADKVLIDGRVLPVAKWNFSSFSLFELSAGYDIQIGHARSDLFSKGNISVGQDSITVLGMTARIAADYFEQWLDIPFSVEIKGQADIAIDEFRIRDGQCETLKGNGQLNNIEVTSQWGLLNLGNGGFSLDCSDKNINVSIDQKSSHMISSFELRLKGFSRYSLNGRVEPQPDLRGSYRDGLRFVGERDKRGGYRVSMQGRI